MPQLGDPLFGSKREIAPLRAPALNPVLNELTDSTNVDREALGLNELMGRVSDSGEGCWTLEAAMGVRFASRGGADSADRLLTARRDVLGSHEERRP